MLDEQETLMAEMWKNYQPYNRASDDKWRSYIVDSAERDVLESEESCVTICKANDGTFYVMS